VLNDPQGRKYVCELFAFVRTIDGDGEGFTLEKIGLGLLKLMIVKAFHE